ncbi:PREDICTED: uncharacterized protein LOC104760484 [Camelina sativa]|uniref:Uncharacterized protein LOC104760484 n=1 Tax=Camelina sativa TaxID=90675 RepID=A0ABM0X737_CAMSA|nr:PREDICTED: uncharacterized protein LOC104760484 [Camelina sativa]
MNNNFTTNQCLLHYDPSTNTGEAEMYNRAITESKSSQIILCSNASKHNRSRSYNRSSKRNMHTTLLNANPSNFRDIVQRFTGRSSGIDVFVGRKGPVTLDFRSPASVTEEVIFPTSGDVQNQYCSIDTHVVDRESHGTCEWEGKHTAASCEMGQLSDDSEGYGGCDDYYAHDHDDDLIREYLKNSSFDGVITMDCDEFYLDAVMVEEFLMKDLDI